MIHHVPLRPPFRDFPADEWNVIEKGFHPEFLAQLETMLARQRLSRHARMPGGRRAQCGKRHPNQRLLRRSLEPTM
jgi:hypothetical protein